MRSPLFNAVGAKGGWLASSDLPLHPWGDRARPVPVFKTTCEDTATSPRHRAERPVLIGFSLLSDKFSRAVADPQVERQGSSRPQPQADPQPTRPCDSRPHGRVGEPLRVRIKRGLQCRSTSRRTLDDLFWSPRDTIAKNSRRVRLLSPACAKDTTSRIGWAGECAHSRRQHCLDASAHSTPLTLTLSWANPTGQRFEQIVSVDDGYLFTIKQRIVNGGNGAVGLRAYGLASRSSISPDPSSWTQHIGPMGYLGGKADYDVDWETLDDDKAGVTRDSRGGACFTDKYWLTRSPPPPALRRATSREPVGRLPGGYLVVFCCRAGRAGDGEPRSWSKDYDRPLATKCGIPTHPSDRLGLVSGS